MGRADGNRERSQSQRSKVNNNLKSKGDSDNCLLCHLLKIYVNYENICSNNTILNL